MSHYYGYSCISHDPPIHSDCDLNHGLDALAEAVPIVRAGVWPSIVDSFGDRVYQDVVGASGHHEQWPIRFLVRHPHCRIAIVDEYGGAWLLDDGLVEVVGPDRSGYRSPARDASGQPTGEWYNPHTYPEEGDHACTCEALVPVVNLREFGRVGYWVRCQTCGGVGKITEEMRA